MPSTLQGGKTPRLKHPGVDGKIWKKQDVRIELAHGWVQMWLFPTTVMKLRFQKGISLCEPVNNCQLFK